MPLYASVRLQERFRHGSGTLAPPRYTRRAQGGLQEPGQGELSMPGGGCGVSPVHTEWLPPGVGNSGRPLPGRVFKVMCPYAVRSGTRLAPGTRLRHIPAPVCVTGRSATLPQLTMVNWLTVVNWYYSIPAAGRNFHLLIYEFYGNNHFLKLHLPAPITVFTPAIGRTWMMCIFVIQVLVFSLRLSPCRLMIILLGILCCPV
jgi:hypothetical protein